MQAGDVTLGTLNTARRRANDYSNDDLRLLGHAAQFLAAALMSVRRLEATAKAEVRVKAPAPAQAKALPDVLDEVLARTNAGMAPGKRLTLANARGHLEAMPGHTDCPGQDVLGVLAKLRS